MSTVPALYWTRLDDNRRTRRFSREELNSAESDGKVGQVLRFQTLTSQALGRQKGEGAASWPRLPS